MVVPYSPGQTLTPQFICTLHTGIAGAHSSATAVTTNCLVQLQVSKCIVLETKVHEHFSCEGSLKSLLCASVRILTASRGTPANSRPSAIFGSSVDYC